MKEHSDPIEFLIEFAKNNGADSFVVNNAKDQLNKLKQRIADLNQDIINADLDYNTVGWAKINDRGDLYDPRFCYNPYIEESYLIPLYVNEKEYKQKYGKLSK